MDDGVCKQRVSYLGDFRPVAVWGFWRRVPEVGEGVAISFSEWHGSLAPQGRLYLQTRETECIGSVEITAESTSKTLCTRLEGAVGRKAIGVSMPEDRAKDVEWLTEVCTVDGASRSEVIRAILAAYIDADLEQPESINEYVRRNRTDDS